MPQTDRIGHSKNVAAQTRRFSPLFTPNDSKSTSVPQRFVHLPTEEAGSEKDAKVRDLGRRNLAARH